MYVTLIEMKTKLSELVRRNEELFESVKLVEKNRDYDQLLRPYNSIMANHDEITRLSAAIQDRVTELSAKKG